MNMEMTHYEMAVKKNLIGTDQLIPRLNKFFEGREADFNLFARWFEFEFSKHPVMNLVGNQEATMTANFLYHYWRMKACGEKIFCVSPQLCYMLLNTDVNVDCECLHAPFEEVYIHCDQDEIIINDSRDGQTRAVRGIYLNFPDVEFDGVRRLRFIATSGAEGCDEAKDVNYHFAFELPKHGTVEEAIKFTFDNMGAGSIKVFDMGIVNKQAIQRVFRFTVNFMLYLSSKDPDIFPVTPQKVNFELKKSPRKIVKAIKRSMRTVEMPYVIVGHNIPTTHTTHRGTGSSISHRFDVRGHWRFQWIGSRSDNSLRQKYTWVKPYQKGKDFGEQLNKKYWIGGGPTLDANIYKPIDESDVDGGSDKPTLNDEPDCAGRSGAGDREGVFQGGVERSQREESIPV